MKINIVRKKVESELIRQPEKHAGGAKQVLHFETHLCLTEPNAKTFDTVKQGDMVMDYRNVKIRGYLSTFQSTTPSDRQGDYVLPGAFKDTIGPFMQNPVLLVNHNNDVDSIAGGFDVLREDDKGLYCEATLSNAEDMKSVRCKVAEGYLRTMSMGGFFTYGQDGRGIEKVSLCEGSLTPVPANPDARFTTRKLEPKDVPGLRKSGLKEYAASFEA